MPFTIERYPAHLIDILRLQDSRRVTIRPVLPQDVDLHRRFLGGLSAASRYNRFLAAVGELSPDRLRECVSVDYRRHVALIAASVDGDRETEVAEARYVLDDAGRAEFALAVADDWQGLGLGGELLRRLEASAGAAGASGMVADTLAANDHMVGLARRAGYRLTADPGAAWLLRLEKPIAARPGAHQNAQAAALLAA